MFIPDRNYFHPAVFLMGEKINIAFKDPFLAEKEQDNSADEDTRMSRSPTEDVITIEKAANE